MRRLLAALAGAALLWAFAVWLAGGVDLRAAGLRLRSTDPWRPALGGIVLGALYFAAARRAGLREDAALVTRLAAPPRLAFAIAVFSAVVAFVFNAATAGGSDSYGYVTHAESWRLVLSERTRVEGSGSFRTPVPLAATAPWPRAIESFTPLAQHPSPDRRALLPVTSPGLPMLMAVFGIAGGHCAMFWVVPLTGALLVWATFLAGRRALSATAGLGAAWLVAASPTVVSMSKSVMSDVPAAAFWALTIACALQPTTRAALAAGLAASVAILIRPNVVILGIWIGLWMIWREWHTAPRTWARVLAYAAGAAPGCIVIAALNSALRGSPWASGYGDLESLFALHHIPANVSRYVAWMMETQTPLWIAGMVALAVPLRRMWPTDDSRRAAVLLLGAAVVVFASYLAYEPFEAWWFLRFLLPAWPAIAIGAAALVLAAGRAAGRWGGRAAAVVLMTVGVYGIATSIRLGVFPPGEGERRYATIAEIVARHTEPESVVITLHHAGSIRYYAARDTIRYDVLDERWLDRAVDWLHQQGRPAYFLLEEADVAVFRQRFGAHNRLARDMSPIVAYKAHRIQGWVYLFDPRRPDAVTLSLPSIVNPSRCALPAASH